MAHIQTLKDNVFENKTVVAIATKEKQLEISNAKVEILNGEQHKITGELKKIELGREAEELKDELELIEIESKEGKVQLELVTS